MDFDQLKQKLQKVYTQRGGTEAAKADGTELRNIVKGDGSLADKAKAAVQALRTPGAPGEPLVDRPPDKSSAPISSPVESNKPGEPIPPQPELP